MNEPRAKKRFGQNFLKDQSIVAKIVESIPSDLPLVEIGPGLGDLTRALLDIQSVVAHEVDVELCERLRSEFSEALESQRLRLVCGDVLTHWGEEGLHDEPYRLVANLPYYVATHIVLKALKDRRCQSLTVMVQKEVADKFAAREGERAFSSLAVLAQSVGDCNVLLDVEPEAFHPAPKVRSSVVYLQKRVLEAPEEGFEKYLKTAFAQPRKTLRKNLSSRYSQVDIDAAFEKLNIATHMRPHEVATSSYHLLYDLLEKGCF